MSTVRFLGGECSKFSNIVKSTEDGGRDFIWHDTSKLVLLRNTVCAYCSVQIMDRNYTKEHVVGRKIVPAGKLDKRWKVGCHVMITFEWLRLQFRQVSMGRDKIAKACSLALLYTQRRIPDKEIRPLDEVACLLSGRRGPGMDNLPGSFISTGPATETGFSAIAPRSSSTACSRSQ